MNHAAASLPLRHTHRRACRADRRPLRLRPLAVALLLAGCAAPLSGLAQAQNRSTLPSGMTVVQGQASASTQGSQLTVTNSANALLNWQSFSIGAGASVRFVQPGADSRVLNRVVGNDPSQIFGQLSSNGQVWLLNANGVLFGREARVDVAGLVASTLNQLPADWQAGRLLLREAGAGSATGASVVNQGELRSTLGGHVLLIGGSGGVRNEGHIEAPAGTVGLAAGRSVELADSRTPNITVRVDAAQGGSGSSTGTVGNVGSLLAAGGQVDLAAAIVNQSGIVRADSLTTAQGSQAGRVTLRGSGSVTLGAGSVTSADDQGGGPAGQVRIDSGATGLTEVGGRVDAKSDAGPGGRIEILGERVGLLNGASADVSGRTGGGELFVGGGALGRDPAIRNARASYIARGARLTADATGAGDGGRIAVWGNDATRAYGQFSARGGTAGGNGGQVETSGGWLDARPASMRTDAPRGLAGQWLLDPYDLTITDAANVQPAADQNVELGVGTSLDRSAVVYKPNNTPSVLTSETIAAALNSGSNVSVSTNGTGGTATTAGTGQVTIDKAHIAVTPRQPVSLTVAADGDLVMSNSRIASTGQPLDVYFSAGTPPVAGTANYRTIRFSNASIDTAGGGYAGSARGVIDLSAAYVQIDGGTTLTSQASGNAITLHQGTGNNLFSFTNDAGATALNTPRGRWRLYISEPYESYAGGGLAHDATIYGTTYPGSGTPDLPTSNLLLFSYQPSLYQTGEGTAISRSYDGSTRVIVSDSGQITGMVNSDRIYGYFNNANVGADKTIELFPGGALAQGIDSSGKPVYGYDGGAIGLTAATNPFTLTGSVTPRLLSVSGATAANKTFDGSSSATITAWQWSNLVEGDQVSVTAARANFADAAVGSAKTVTATALALGGRDGANYQLNSEGNTAVTQASILPPRVDDRGALKPPPMPPLKPPATPTDGRTLDATGAMTFDASGRSTFNALDLANLPADRVAAILETRQRYKESAFAGALQQLEVNPNLADAPACLTIAQVSSGACLVTSELKAAVGPREQTTVAAAPTGPSAAAIGTGPAAPSGASP
ncbi:MAG TPA: filamentous hemagglutinin N-terminal domain-containing protein, partial [Burkholderiaceae bacterium]|nr:filamentous hemagglutinin N-terminal domain-containing protein [Burkholderiaceae bacterium]